MNTLCFMSNLTSAEWASWAQAILAGVAIITAALISNRQSKSQYEGARKLQQADLLRTQMRITGAIGMLAKSSGRVVDHVATSLATRDQVHDVGAGRVRLDLGELNAISGAVSAISLHDLPTPELVSLAMILSSTIRQFDNFLKSSGMLYGRIVK
ncbi:MULTISPECIES: hypothetical protein [unclassified Duganella]|uniref:hypothetical protein n=1 Tax=unclassified Duganella TaxID=2636909 RepID=UPI0011144270|nr:MULTISPECIES: hypothetical protein [unclassified Duganella]